jgi:chemotaxis family two-component system response regulator Rcp1
MNILLIEDNLGDGPLTEEALKQGNFQREIELHVLSDGEKAMQYLLRKEPFEQVSTPDMIFLDLELRCKDGREVLREIKGHPKLKRIPVVILTASNADKDVRESYELHANCYITKPVDIKQFIEVLRYIENFWFAIVKLPTHKL